MYARIGCWFDCEMIICMCTKVGNSPYRIYLYWALAHPVVGPHFQVQDRYRQTTLLRGRDDEAGRTVALILVLCLY